MRYKGYKLITEEELKRYLEFLYIERKLKISEIAEEIGASIATTSRLFKKFNFKLNQNTSRIPYEEYGFESQEHLLTTINQCLALNMTKKEIAKNIGCNEKTISRICKKYIKL